MVDFVVAAAGCYGVAAVGAVAVVVAVAVSVVFVVAAVVVVVGDVVVAVVVDFVAGVGEVAAALVAAAPAEALADAETPKAGQMLQIFAARVPAGSVVTADAVANDAGGSDLLLGEIFDVNVAIDLDGAALGDDEFDDAGSRDYCCYYDVD